MTNPQKPHITNLQEVNEDDFNGISEDLRNDYNSTIRDICRYSDQQTLPQTYNIDSDDCYCITRVKRPSKVFREITGSVQNILSNLIIIPDIFIKKTTENEYIFTNIPLLLNSQVRQGQEEYRLKENDFPQNDADATLPGNNFFFIFLDVREIDSGSAEPRQYLEPTSAETEDNIYVEQVNTRKKIIPYLSVLNETNARDKATTEGQIPIGSIVLSPSSGQTRMQVHIGLPIPATGIKDIKVIKSLGYTSEEAIYKEDLENSSLTTSTTKAPTVNLLKTTNDTLNTAIETAKTEAKNARNALIPVGTIIAVHPGTPALDTTYWRECDGDTVPSYTIGGVSRTVMPNLTDTFFSGTSSGTYNSATYATQFFGGENNKRLSINNIPPHSHSGTTDGAGSHRHGVHTGSSGSGESSVDATTSRASGRAPVTTDAPDHTHTFTTTAAIRNNSGSQVTSSTGTPSTFDNRPKFFRVRYWMRVTAES